MTSSIKVVDLCDRAKFETAVNDLLQDGYRILSSSSGLVNSEAYDFCSSFQAILIKEEPLSSNEELFTLTASKDHLVSMLYVMCDSCKKKGCDFCILRNCIPDIKKECLFDEFDWVTETEGKVYFDIAVSNGLIRKASP